MDSNQINTLIKQFQAQNTANMFHKDFLLTWEKTGDELMGILLCAQILRGMRENNISPKIFDSGLGVSIFRDKSTRTRFSFAGAASMLGLAVQELDETKTQVAHGETVRETANMISFLTETIGIRDDMYLGEGNTYMREVASALEEGFQEGVLPTRPTVVNLQCDIDHPTQTMADLLHMVTYFGGLKNLKGKKIAMTWAYSPSYGKPLSVPQGVIGLMSRFGMEVSLAYPEGYTLISDTVDRARKQSQESGGTFTLCSSMEEAFKDADMVYPKSWAPYGVMEERTELLKKKDLAGLEELEKKCLENNRKYVDWECNEKLMAETKRGKALYMHCLPADITGVSCDNGEVSKEVFGKYRIQTYKQAGWKPYIIAAMIFLSRVQNPGEALSSMIKKGKPRSLFT